MNKFYQSLCERGLDLFASLIEKRIKKKVKVTPFTATGEELTDATSPTRPTPGSYRNIDPETYSGVKVEVPLPEGKNG